MPNSGLRALVSVLLWSVVLMLYAYALGSNLLLTPAHAAVDHQGETALFVTPESTVVSEEDWDWGAINARIAAGTGAPVCAVREGDVQVPPLTERMPAAECVNGSANGFWCENVD